MDLERQITQQITEYERIIAEAEEDLVAIDREIALIPVLLQARRDREAKQSWTPQYTGSVVVVDTADRPLDSYKLGDQITFAGFNSVLDNVVARIVGISRTPHNATLNLSFVLPTINRRLQEVEGQN